MDKKNYLEMMDSATEGNPWSYEKYHKHMEEIASPFICTIGDY